MPELEPLYLVVVRGWGREVLVEAQHRSLPRLSLPPDTGLVRGVADGFWRRYGIDICVLFSFESPEIEPRSDSDDLTWTPIPGTEKQIVVGQPWSGDLPRTSGMVWAPASAVTGDEHTVQSLLRALQLLWDRAIGRVPEPLGRCQWFEGLLSRMVTSGDAGVGYRLRHWSGNGTAAVVRMESREGCRWLKVSARAGAETSTKLACALAYLGLPYVPAALEYIRPPRDDWDGLIQENIEGVTLRRSGQAQDWCETARRIAEIQIAAIGKISTLLAGGCADWTWSRIQRGAGRLFRWIKSEALHRDDLLGIAAYRKILPSLSERLQSVLQALQEREVPSTLMRLRFSPEDVVVHDARGPCFVTWSASAVGFPFVWWHWLAEAAACPDGHCRVPLSALRAAYLDPWNEVLGAEEAEHGLRSAPLVATLLEAVRIAGMGAIKGMDAMDAVDEHLPAERLEWAWELTRDPLHLAALRQPLETVIRQLMDREAAA